MNDAEWEYILLHSLPKEWIQMTDEVQPVQTEEKHEEPKSSEKDTTEKRETTEGEKVSGNGSTGKENTNSVSSPNGGKTDTHSVGQGTETKSGGREHSGASGTNPGEPISVPTGDAGKDQSGNWKTRTTQRKSFGFQKRFRERQGSTRKEG